MFTSLTAIEENFGINWKGGVRLGDLFNNGDYKSLSSLKFSNLNIPQTQGVYRLILPHDLIGQVNFQIPTDIVLKRGKSWYTTAQLEHKINSQNSRCYLNSDRENDLIVYVGKADDLQRRLKQYLKFPVGAAHFGGRAIWQMDCWQDLILQWATTVENAETVEKECLKFIGQNDLSLFPLANWRN